MTKQCSRVIAWTNGVPQWCKAPATHTYWRSGHPARPICQSCLTDMTVSTLIHGKIMSEQIQTAEAEEVS